MPTRWGLRLAAIYKDEAEKDLKLSETAETPPEAEAFMRESNASFDEMWAICTMLLEKSQWINWPTMWSL